MSHLKTILQSMMFALVMAIGGIGTAAAGGIGAGGADAPTGDVPSATGQHGAEEVLKGSDKDDDEDDEDDDW